METSGGGSSALKTPPKAVEALKKDISFDVPTELSHSTHQGTAASAPTPEEATASTPSSPADRRESIIKRLRAWSPMLVLENSGSVGKHSGPRKTLTE
jgi:hypothetical protein